jgi:uroporphyrinogen decarboxylase
MIRENNTPPETMSTIRVSPFLLLFCYAVRMTSREVLTAIFQDKRCPERMGAFEWFWQDTQAAWERQGLPPRVDIHEYFDLDVREIKYSMFRTTGRPVDDVVIDEDAETVVKLNGWGARHREWKNKPGVPEHLGFELTNAGVWKREFRDFLLDLDPCRFPDWGALKAAYKEGLASSRFCVYQQMLVVEIMRRAMGDVVFLESMVLDPAWIHDFCSVVTDMIIRHLDHMIREVGKPDGIWTYDDMGYTRAPFFSPAMYREFIFPYHKRLADFCHDHGLPIILHACGRIRPFLPDLAAAGFDGLQSMEVKADQNVAEFASAVRAAGREMGFAGNIDIRAFESNDPATLNAEIVPKLEAIRKNKIPYVFMSDHSIPKTVSLATYEKALEIYRHDRIY